MYTIRVASPRDSTALAKMNLEFNHVFVESKDIDLKRYYRKIVMKTHPDAVGSDRLVDKYVEYRNYYEEAKAIIKKEKPRGPYRKYALLFNMSPIFHNILSYQLTGLQFYKKQLRQNFAGIMHQLEERKFDRLIEYIQFLIKDMECGPVIQESD